MKKIILNILTSALIFFTVSHLSAQFTVNTIQTPAPGFGNTSICDHVTLNLNGTDLNGSDCEFSTDFSNVETGTNTLSISSELNPLVNTSTLDMVKVMRAIDEGFESYAEGIAADFNSDAVISTDDLILMRRIVLGIETEIPAKAKIASVNSVFEPLINLQLDSDHTEYNFENTEVQDGVPTDLIIICAGCL